MAKKKAKGGIKKGAPYENEMAKELSWWFSWGERSDLIRRTKASGGWATERDKVDLPAAYQHGDLSPTHPSIYPFFDLFLVEVKRGYTGMDILNIVDQPPGFKEVCPLMDWWEKAEKEKEISKRLQTMILFKRDRRKKMVAISSSLKNALKIYDREGILIKNKIFIMDMAEFFCHIDPEDVSNLISFFRG